jgi:hypothetical protein
MGSSRELQREWQLKLCADLPREIDSKSDRSTEGHCTDFVVQSALHVKHKNEWTKNKRIWFFEGEFCPNGRHGIECFYVATDIEMISV